MSNRALFWNSASSTLLLVANIVVSFFMSPFLVHHFGDGGYGFWELLLSLVGYLGILDLGVGPAIVRFVAHANGAGDKVRVNDVVKTGFVAFSIAGIIGFFLIAAVAYRPEVVFGTLPLDARESRLIVLIFAVIFLLTFSRATFTSSLMGLELHRVVNSVRVVSTVIQALLIYVLLEGGSSHALLRAALAYGSIIAIEATIFGLIITRAHGIRLGLRNVNWAEARSLATFGAKSVGSLASTSLVTQGTLFVLAHASGSDTVTYYVLSARLVDYGQNLAMALGGPIMPHLAGVFSSRGIEGMRRTWINTARWLQFVFAGLAMCLWWLGPAFLGRWVGVEYASRGAPIFFLLSAAMLIQVPCVNAKSLLVSMNRHGKLASISVLIGALSLLVTYLAVQAWGLWGAATGTFFFRSIIAIIELWLGSAVLGISMTRHAFTAIRRYLPPIVIGSLAFMIMRNFRPPNDYREIFLQGFIGGSTYLIMCLYFAMTKDERTALLSFASRSRRRNESASTHS